jgi:Lysozyme inhibitor LprI
VEKAICADPHLSSLDDQMAEAYRDALSKAGDDVTAVRQGQRAWLKDLNASCTGAGIGACIEKRETERIQALNSGAAATSAKPAHAAPESPPSPVCLAARDNLNKALKELVKQGADSDPLPFPSWDLEFKEGPDPMPKALQSEADQNSGFSLTAADAVLGGKPVKVVSLAMSAGPSTMCTPPSYYEVWSKDFGKMLGQDDASDVSGNSDLLMYNNKPYVADHQNVGEMSASFVLKEIKDDGSFDKACEFELEKLQKEVAVIATDPLCDAVAAGQVETLAPKGAKPVRISYRALGNKNEVDPEGSYELVKPVTADIDNDRHDLHVAVVHAEVHRHDLHTGHICSMDELLSSESEWAVVLNQRGLPASGIDVQAGEVRFIRFGGVNYLESRTEADSPQQSHDVWKLTANGKTKVCSYLTQQYAIH